MYGVSLTLTQVNRDTLAYVESLLEENSLPSSDVRSKPDTFYIAYDEDERIGVGGVETHGTNGLLRSVVVERSKRGTGYGAALCDALENEAVSNNIGTLYLLTTTASGFFETLGYVAIPRNEAPTGIQRTAEFDELCPTTATCMKKNL
jgi:amino-acid N-acetyltransferase